MSLIPSAPVGSGQPGCNSSLLGRRTSARQAGLRKPPSRPQLNRFEPGTSGLAAPLNDPNASLLSAATAAVQRSHDDSDDEIPVPHMKLSAFTAALLSDKAGAERERGENGHQPPSRPISRMVTRRAARAHGSSSSIPEHDVANSSVLSQPSARETRRHVRAASVQVSMSRPTSPQTHQTRMDSSPVRKRVALTNNTPGGLRRSLSGSAKRPASRSDLRDYVGGTSQPAARVANDSSKLNTPSQPVRRVQIVVGSGSRSASSSSSAAALSGVLSNVKIDEKQPVGQVNEDPHTMNKPVVVTNPGSVSRFGSSVTRHDDQNLAGSIRVKRVSKVSGSFLSGPARRGRRRQSEEDDVIGEGDEGQVELGISQESEHQHAPLPPPPPPQPSSPLFVASNYHDIAAMGSPVSSNARHNQRKLGAASLADLRPAQKVQIDTAPPPPSSRENLKRPIIPSGHDQENGLQSGLQRQMKHINVLGDKEPDNKPLRVAAAKNHAVKPLWADSPERKALGILCQNTPHVVIPQQRHVPAPPPKMSILDTATTAGGAATAAQKKKSIFLKVNGKAYHRLDCIGRGGSAKVYRVSAESGQMFAMKRVMLAEVDEMTVRGYRGEIMLLQKLKDVDRVIRLFDFELNEEKQILSLLMEMGETDFNSHLGQRHNSNMDGPKLDIVFVRYYWKEMLECLEQVHAHNVVHSDLKPDNFVLVQGRLKLIDFGIANAIQTDHTVNVHRHQQVGTPNYMSPESLMDSERYAFSTTQNGRLAQPFNRGPKIMKIGKPSDIWSLGCILYRMVYGAAPFAHIKDLELRCQTITKRHHNIDFPQQGLGGVSVPPSLLKTMRDCLNFEQQMRPTCEDLLAMSDPFLYPVEYMAPSASGGGGSSHNNNSNNTMPLPITEEMLKTIINNVVTRCRSTVPAGREESDAWAAAYWTNVRKNLGFRDPPGVSHR